MLQNATMASEAPADNITSFFQISYIYLSTTGLVLTLVGSNLLTFIFPIPPAGARKRSLYSTLVWNVPFYQKYWSDDEERSEDDMIQLTDEITKTDEISFLKTEPIQFVS